MKKVAIILILILQVNQSYSQTKNFLDKSYLETNTYVDTLVVPDRIFLSILIAENDTKNKVSVEELERKMDKKLKKLNIDVKKQLTLSDASSNFKQYFLKRKGVIKSKAYTLLVYDAKTAGRVIAELEEVNISNVNLEKIEYSKYEEAKLYLRQRAVKKAKLQASLMLETLGQNLGKAIYISDLNSNIYKSQRNTIRKISVKGYSDSEEDKQESIDIEFEKIKIEASVIVKFEMD